MTARTLVRRTQPHQGISVRIYRFYAPGGEDNNRNKRI